MSTTNHSDSVARMLEGLTGGDQLTENRQDFPAATDTLSCLPWSDDQRAADWTRVYKHLLDNPSGVPLSLLCERLFGDTNADGRTYSSADYEACKRFLEKTEIARLSRSTGTLEAQPTPEAFSLDLGKQNSYSSAESRSEVPENPENPLTEAIGLGHKEWAESYISATASIDTAQKARTLARPYLRYLESIDDSYLIMRDDMNPGDSYLLMPYHTRFNDASRASDQWRRYHTAWDRATDSYRHGIHITLTTDPSRYGSISAMTDGIFEAWSGLLEAMNQRYDGTGRLDYIRALEWTTKGYPHLHVVVFGLKYENHAWLKHYWDVKADHAEIVWIDRLNQRGGDWVHHNSRTGDTFEAKAYLGDYLSKTFENIEVMVTEQLDRVADLTGEVLRFTESGNPVLDFMECGIWKMALYWATGRQFWDSSHGLKAPNPDCLEDVPGLGETKLKRLRERGIHTLAHVRLASRDELTEVPGLGDDLVDQLLEFAGEPSDFDLGRWTFVGAADYENIPLHVCQNATLLGVSPAGSEPEAVG